MDNDVVCNTNVLGAIGFTTPSAYRTVGLINAHRHGFLIGRGTASSVSEHTTPSVGRGMAVKLSLSHIIVALGDFSA
jgi:hypothetical protein